MMGLRMASNRAVIASARPSGGAPSSRGGAAQHHERAQIAEIQRARIVAAMVNVASERGVAGANVGRVVARAGVSRRTFYEVFAGGEECFLAAFEHSLALAGGRVLDAYDPTEPWRVRVRSALVAALCFLDEEPAMGRLLVVESLAAGPTVLARRARALLRLAAAVEEGREQGKSGATVPSRLTAEGVVGAVLSVIHSRMVDCIHYAPARSPGPISGPASAERLRLAELTSQLMSIVVLPYLGPAAARREAALPAPAPSAPKPLARASHQDALVGIPIRITRRTVRVLAVVAAGPGASNRQIGEAAGISDQGQISKLLRRLEHRGLLLNGALDSGRGAPNSWTLTPRGAEIERVVNPESDGHGR